MKKLKIVTVLLFLITTFLLTSCGTVKPYQKVYLNDIDMQLTNAKLKVFELNFESYREGTAGANGGKVGGGCGCN